MHKYYTFLFFLSFLFGVSAQNLDSYKYVIVPQQFNFQKSADKYQLNSLTKFLFEKEGFKTIFNDEKYPEDLYQNPCLGLNSNVAENSNMFTTKLTIELIDCQNKIVFTSLEGSSKIKDLKRGHHEALRKAFESVKSEDYSFDSSLIKTNAKIKKEEVVEVIEEDITTNEDLGYNDIEVTEVSKEENTSSEIKDTVSKEVPLTTVEDSSENILYAQAITNGIQLVDNTPKIIFKALKSQKNENVYYLQNKAGVLYKKDSMWYAEYYKGEELVVEKLTIKF